MVTSHLQLSRLSSSSSAISSTKSCLLMGLVLTSPSVRRRGRSWMELPRFGGRWWACG